MRFHSSVLFVGCLTVCVGCTPDDEISLDLAPRIDVQELNINFAFHEPLTLRVSNDEALLSGATTQMQVQTLPYREKVVAVRGQMPSWALPERIATRVRDERSCAPLMDPAAFLPVDTISQIQCDLVIDPSGRPVVWMVGMGRPFEDLPFLQSSFLVLEDTQYHLFSYVYPFPESEVTVQWMFDTFDERHPPMSPLIWPNKSFKLLSTEVTEMLAKEITPPSAEVQAIMDALRTLAFSVRLSTAQEGVDQ